MFNGNPPLPNAPTTLSTEMIQKYLEENAELIMAILEGQNQGKFAEASQCLAKLQHNLTYLAKLADDAPQPQAQTHSQGQGMQHPPPPPHHHVAMSQQQPDLPTFNPPFDTNEQLQQHQQQQQQHQQQHQQQQHHLAMSLQQSGVSASRLPFQMNKQQHKLPGFFQQQQQLVPGPMFNFAGTNSGMYQAPQTRLSNMPDMPETNQIGSGVSSGWSFGKSPSGPTIENKRP